MKNDLLLQRSLMPIDREETGTDELIIERVRDINKLTAYGKCVQSNLPPKYTELEYVTFNGTQVLDTLYYPNQDTRIITKFLPSVNNCWLYGASPNNPRITLYSSSTGNSRFGNSVVDNLGFTADIEYNIIQDKNGIEINGVSNPYTTVDTNPFTTSYTLTIGNCNGSSGTLYYSGRFYYQRIYDNNILVRDYVPARRNSDNVLGMYDRVSGDFLVNQGTGDFVAGPDVVLTPIPGGHAIPTDYSELEYILTDGNSYINTGYIPTGKPTIKTKIYSDYQAQYAGCRWTSAPKYDTIGCIYSISGLTVYYGLYENGEYIQKADYQAGTVHTLELTESSVILDNQEYSITRDSLQASSDYPYLIGAFNNIGTILATTSSRIYYYEISEGGNLIFRLVPARRKSDNVLGMFDLVSGNFLTNSGTGSFTAGPEIPSRPIDIWCNNGVLRARHQSGLPLGYTKIDYLESSGTQYIDTGRVPNNNDIIEQKFQKVGTSTTTCSWYGSMPSSQEIVPRMCIGSYTSPASTRIFAGSNYTGIIEVVDTNVHILRFQATGENELTYTFDGVTNVITAPVETTNMYDPAVELTSYLFARHGTNGVQVYDNEGTKIYYHREYLANGTLVLNMVPVKRNSDDILGMYDLVSGTFFTNAGTGDFIAGPVVSDPVEIYTSGPSEVIKINNNLTPPECSNLLGVGNYRDSQEVLGGNISRSVGIKVLDGTENWQNISQYYNISKTDLGTDSTVLPSASINIICTHYETISGVPDRTSVNVGLNYVNFRDDNISTLADFKQWLADQYAAETPVIVVYPLATPTQETVEGQGINFEIGTNKVEAAQDDIDGLSFTVRYRQK